MNQSHAVFLFAHICVAVHEKHFFHTNSLSEVRHAHSPAYCVHPGGRVAAFLPPPCQASPGASERWRLPCRAQAVPRHPMFSQSPWPQEAELSGGLASELLLLSLGRPERPVAAAPPIWNPSRGNGRPGSSHPCRGPHGPSASRLSW